MLVTLNSLNPFGVREVSKLCLQLLSLKKLRLNPFGVREVSKLKKILSPD